MRQLQSGYKVRIHRLLADAGLAPQLIYASIEDSPSKLYGGSYMIIMDYVENDSTSVFSVDQLGDIRRAMDLLHEKNLVFGDPQKITVINRIPILT